MTTTTKEKTTKVRERIREALRKEDPVEEIIKIFNDLIDDGIKEFDEINAFATSETLRTIKKKLE